MRRHSPNRRPDDVPRHGVPWQAASRFRSEAARLLLVAECLDGGLQCLHTRKPKRRCSRSDSAELSGKCGDALAMAVRVPRRSGKGEGSVDGNLRHGDLIQRKAEEHCRGEAPEDDSVRCDCVQSCAVEHHEVIRIEEDRIVERSDRNRGQRKRSAADLDREASQVARKEAEKISPEDVNRVDEVGTAKVERYRWLEGLASNVAPEKEKLSVVDACADDSVGQRAGSA